MTPNTPADVASLWLKGEIARVHRCASMGIRFHADPEQIKALSAEIAALTPAGEGGSWADVALCLSNEVLPSEQCPDTPERWLAAMRSRLATTEQPGSSVQGVVSGGMESRLAAAGVFKGHRGLRGLAECNEFWQRQPYGTRLYYGANGLDYLHRSVLQAAIKVLDTTPPPAPAAEQGDAIAIDGRTYALDTVRTALLGLARDVAAQDSAQPEARGVEGMRNALEEIATVAHSDQSESDLETVLAWLASIVDPLLAATPNPVRAEQPEGKWKLVPVEPTEAMKGAGMEASPLYPLTGKGKRVGVSTDEAAVIYRAMLAAAASPGVRVDGEWLADVRRCLEDVSTEMRSRGRGDERFQRLIQRMPAALAPDGGEGE